MQLRRITFPCRSALALLALCSVFLFSPALRAQQPTQDSHIISSAQLQRQVQSSAATRQENINILNQFLSTAAAQQAMRISHVTPTQIKTAIPNLTDAQLANLSSRAQHAQQDFAAGRLSNGAWLIIALAVIVVLILVIVH